MADKTSIIDHLLNEFLNDIDRGISEHTIFVILRRCFEIKGLSRKAVIDYLRRSTKNPQEHVLLGFLYERCETPYERTLAYTNYEKAANCGDPYGEFFLGKCCLHGIGETVDYERAAQYFQKAAEKGNSSGQFYIANCYSEGCGVKPNDVKMAFWMKKSAKNGHHVAQFSLAEFYQYGDLVVQDIHEAIKWYRKSWKNGNDVAPNKLKNLLTSPHSDDEDTC